MERLRYSDLTIDEKSKICNGCGGKGGWIKPPSFIFKASCNHHDFLYWRGKDESDRKYADKAFYRYMGYDIEKAKWYMKLYFYPWAFAYYSTVRCLGKKFFNYSSEYKTLADI